MRPPSRRALAAGIAVVAAAGTAAALVAVFAGAGSPHRRRAVTAAPSRSSGPERVAGARIVFASGGAAARAFHIDGDPAYGSFLSFALPAGVGWNRAVLRLYANSRSASGYVVDVYRDGRASVGSGGFAAGAWTAVDVTRLLGRRGHVTFLLADPSTTAINLAGRESDHPPQLLLETTARARRAASAAPLPAGSEQGRLLGGATAIVAAAGDIACAPGAASSTRGGASCDALATSRLLLGIPHLAAVLPLGDTQYECGSASAFAASYARTWGRLKTLSHPVVGNHEYGRSCRRDDATPYFRYFGAAAGPFAKGWYSYDLARWHLIALNSECLYGKGASAVGGCGPGSPQERWLRADLARHRSRCTLAYWHEPRFSSGEHGDAFRMATIWNDLVAAHVDVVLSGHNHDYERFAPLGATPAPPAPRDDATTTGAPIYQQPRLAPNGIREFVVGTGGKNHYRFATRETATANPPLRGEAVRDDTHFGVLELALRPRSYSWRFVDTSGVTLDSGTARCH